MQKNMVLPDENFGRDHRLIRKVVATGHKAGAGQEFWAKLAHDKNLFTKVVAFVASNGSGAMINQNLARAVMGKNYWGVEEWSSLYGMSFSEKQLRMITDFPWCLDILNAPCPFVKGKSIRETHFAFLGVDRMNGKPFTILKWHDLHPATDQPKFYFANKPWYSNQKFTTELTCGLRWYLMPLEIVPESTSKTYQEQVAMLPPSYEVPCAIEEVMKHILYYRKNSIYINLSRWGRCQDITSGSYRARIGDFGKDGLCVGDYLDSDRYYKVGVAASRKVPNLKILKH